MRNKGAKRNMLRALQVSLATGLSFGTIAMAVAVPVTLNTDGIKEFQIENLNTKFPYLRNFLAMSETLAKDELSRVYLIDKIDGFKNFKKRRRRSALHAYDSSKYEWDDDTAVYLYQRPHLDNRFIYVETKKDPVTKNEIVELAFEFSGIEVVDLLETFKLGNSIIAQGQQGRDIHGPFKELLNEMREISIRSMRFMAKDLGLDLDKDEDPVPGDFINSSFKVKLQEKIDELQMERDTRQGNHFLHSSSETHYEGQDGFKYEVTQEDVFEKYLFHNMEMQREFASHLLDTTQKIKEQAFKNVINRANEKEMQSIFKNPIYWLEAISQIVVNKDERSSQFVIDRLSKMLYFSKKYAPYESTETMDKAFYNAINITIDELLEQYPPGLNNSPSFHIPQATEGQTYKRLKTVLNITSSEKRVGDFEKTYAKWKPIDFEVLMDKSDSGAKAMIFRTTNMKKPTTVFATTALNGSTQVKGFTGFKNFNLIHDEFMPAFNELIESADSDATNAGPEYSYLLKTVQGTRDLNQGFLEYKPLFSFLADWYSLYNTELTRVQNEAIGDIDQTIEGGVGDFNEHLFGGADRNNWIYKDLTILIAQICTHEIVRDRHYTNDSRVDPNTNQNILKVNAKIQIDRAAIATGYQPSDLYRHFVKEGFMPGTPEYKPWDDPYQLVEEIALSMNELGIKVDKTSINKYIMRKRRRRRR